MRKALDVSEKVLAAIITELGPEKFVAALNNVSAHGKVFTDADLFLDREDKLLGEWFEGIEKLRETAKKIAKLN